MPGISILFGPNVGTGEEFLHVPHHRTLFYGRNLPHYASAQFANGMSIENFPSKRVYRGLFLVTLSTLMYEILLTRIFSVITWYHFAFVAISAAMFGMTVGALVVYLRPAYFDPQRVAVHLSSTSFLFSTSIVVGFLLELIVPFLVTKSSVDLSLMPLEYLVISVPFLFSGICVCLALTRFPEFVGKLYAADLAGAAVGCLLLVWILDIIDGPTAVIVIACVAGFGSVSFASGGVSKKLRRAGIAWVACCASFALVHAILVHEQMPLLRLWWVKGTFDPPHLYEQWNAFSRIVVDGDSSTGKRPFGWGISPRWPSHRVVRELRLTIDGAATTVLTQFDGDLEKVEHLKFDLPNLVHYIRPNSRVLVIGVGGGRDVLAALAFNQVSVQGIEMNDAIIKVVNDRFGEFTGHLDKIPNVTFVHDEARSYVARSRDQFDIIQASFTDTWAATAAGAYVLGENSLYTVEAWEVFLEHLTERGILTFSRWYYRDRPGEMYRLTSLAAAALKSMGVSNPRDHIIVARRMQQPIGNWPDGVGTLLLGRRPFSEGDLDTIERVANTMEFELVLTPRYCLDTTFTILASGHGLRDFVDSFPLNIAPPTDDSPFYFHMLRMQDILSPDLRNQGVMSMNMSAVAVLGGLLLFVVGLTFLCIIVPLLLTGSRLNLRTSWPFLAFFASIGLGFMLVEISQMQRLIVFLGHPILGLSVVLFSLLLGTGVGSFVTERMRIFRTSISAILAFAGLLALLIVVGLAVTSVIKEFKSASTFLRVLASSAMLFPLGVFMGMPLPIGMRAASRMAGSITPWLWGVNGATSVCASVLAVVIAMSSGISTTYWFGVAAYGIALLAFLYCVPHDGLNAE